MNFNSQVYNHPSRRNVIYSQNGMVATGHPIAAQAGLEILRKGGNAIDAAIATATTLTVVEPTANGIGGDNFSIIWAKDKLHGMNSSGKSPKSISIDKLKEKGLKEIPKHGFTPVTVPGAVGGWIAMSEKFGALPLEEVMEPAIRYAHEGVALNPGVAYNWEHAFKSYSKILKGEEFQSWFKSFAPDGRAPRVGEVWKSPDHGKSLELIAKTKGKAFYEGELAERIHNFSKKHDGFISIDDLKEFKSEWVDPISINYRGYEVWELPPNGHGIVALMALNILKGFEFTHRESVDTFHKQFEAMKLAFVDGKKYIADKKHMTVTIEELLSDEYAAKRREMITNEAIMPMPGKPKDGGTVYLSTADNMGNMVSMIQSNYMGFGSGLVVPETGIALHNRGHNFSFNQEDDNALAPNKKPYHTIIPGFLTKDNAPVGPFGVMGGFMQPQGHVQVITNTIDFNMNPQDALDAYRWQWTGEKSIEIEGGFPNHLALELKSMGHDIKKVIDVNNMGRGQIIWKTGESLCAGTEPRTDGSIAIW